MSWPNVIIVHSVQIGSWGVGMELWWVEPGKSFAVLCIPATESSVNDTCQSVCQSLPVR